jgi:hypothetical protein
MHYAVHALVIEKAFTQRSLGWGEATKQNIHKFAPIKSRKNPFAQVPRIFFPKALKPKKQLRDRQIILFGERVQDIVQSVPEPPHNRRVIRQPMPCPHQLSKHIVRLATP